VKRSGNTARNLALAKISENEKHQAQINASNEAMTEARKVIWHERQSK